MNEKPGKRQKRWKKQKENNKIREGRNKNKLTNLIIKKIKKKLKKKNSQENDKLLIKRQKKNN